MNKLYKIKKIILIFIILLSINCFNKWVHNDEYINTYLTFKVEKGNPVRFNLMFTGFENSYSIKDVFVNRNKLYRFNLKNGAHYLNSDDILENYIYYKFSNRSNNIIYSEGLAVYVSSLSKVIFPNDIYWDSQLVFNKNEIDTGECYTVYNERKIDTFTNLKFFIRDIQISPEYTNYKCTNFESVFRISDFPTPASIKRNFRIINKSKTNIKIKTYKSANLTEGYKSVSWSTSTSWETVASSGGVETIFESNYDYTGPFLFEIYDNNTNQLLWTEKVKHFDFKNINENKLNWRKKNKTDVSNYQDEFYAEFPKK